MKKTAIMFLLLAAGAGFLLLAAGSETIKAKAAYAYDKPKDKNMPPPWAPAHGRRAKHRYLYYPGAKVYFEASRGMYFYFSGGKWRASVKLPVSISLNLDESVTLEMDTDKPYKFQAEVEKRYPPGKLKKSYGRPPAKKGRQKKPYY